MAYFCESLCNLWLLLEIPLHGDGRIDEEGLVVVGVIDKVVAELHLAADAEMIGKIIPELGLGENDELSVAVGLLDTPEIDEAREGTLLVGKIQAPHSCQLETVVGRSVVVALEETLIHQLHLPGLREVGVMAIVGPTEEGGVLVTAGYVVKAAIVLDVGGEWGFLAEFELTRDLRIGTAEELAGKVEVDKIVPGAPFVGLELLKGDGDFLAVWFLIWIDVTTEVVMQLDILSVGREGCYSHQGEEINLFIFF